MKDQNKNNLNITKHLDEIERHISLIKQLVFTDTNIKEREDLFVSPDGKVVEGIFDGESMVDKDGKKYLVSPNYASKSQLIEGDKLKLTIAQDGRFLYKQIGPIDRKYIICTLEKSGSQYYALCKNKKYRILLASVTYFKANTGDKLTVAVPESCEASWAAVVNVVNSKDKES